MSIETTDARAAMSGGQGLGLGQSGVDWTLALRTQERIALASLCAPAPAEVAFEHDTAAGNEVSAEPSDPFLERWSKAFAKGDMAALQRRLAWDGLSPERVIKAWTLTAPSPWPAPGAEAPRWFSSLQVAIASFEHCFQNVIEQCGRGPVLLLHNRFRQSGQPFAEAWWPWANAWVESLLAEQPSSLAESALEDLKAELLAELCRIGADALFERFQQVRAAPDGSTHYRRFIRSLDAGAWRALFQTQPLLARQIGQTLAQKTQDVLRLDRDWRDDQAQLASVFGLSPQAQIERLVALGDAHGGGRRVRAVDSGAARLIYKPRAGELEVAWNTLLRTLNARGLNPAMPSLAGFAGSPASPHAWFARVEAAPTEHDAVRLRFQQLGVLCALTTMFRSRDLHQENLIMSEDGPLVIDAETILQPEGQPFASGNHGALAVAADALESSCLATGFVRFPAQSAKGERFDESALCGSPRSGNVMGWSDLGTDRLERAELSTGPRQANHRVRTPDGTLHEACDYLAELCDGFSAAYRCLTQANADAALDEVITAMAQARIRVVMRASRQYQSVLDALVTARVQRQGRNADLIIDTMHRHWAQHTERPALWPLTRGEAEALLRGDLPVTHTEGGDTRLSCEDTVLTAAWTESAVSALRRRLSDMTEQRLAQHLHWLRSGLSPDPARAESRESSVDATRNEERAAEPYPPGTALTAPELRAVVLNLAQQLLAAGIKGQDDEITWLAPSHLRSDARHGHGVSHYLYDGSLGIAWFLAAAGRVLQRSELADAARHAAGPVRRFLRDPAAALLVAREPWGIGHGLGSLVAGLTALGQELADPALLDDAERAMALLQARDPGKSDAVDLEGGIAGALLAVVRLIEATGSRTWLRVARPLVRRLRELRFSNGWRQEGSPLAGFMHGQSGIGYALRAYASISQDEAALTASEDAFGFEDAHFDQDLTRWPVRLDLGREGQRDFSHTWCNGIAGILPARFAYGRVPSPDERRLLEAAAVRLFNQVPCGVDHLCCGNLGRAVVLGQLGRQLGQSEAVQRAEAWLGSVVRAAELRGRFALRDDPQQDLVFQPGLLRGVAGIGMAVLSLGWPERMGSVLTFKSFSR